jgi:2-polyprenyl-3-methyl-5-hydroxy-6-metoxy-1,4-benzoquinol methylase
LNRTTEHIEIDRCPVCGCGEHGTAFKKDPYTGKRCLRCDLVYLSPRAADVNDVYTDDKTSSPSKYYILSEKYDRLTFEKRLKVIEGYSTKGNFMDIGCSVGNFLSEAEKHGWNAVGIEPNPGSAGICRKKGLKVEQAFLNEDISSKYTEHFNSIYMGDVIEHVEDPLELVRLAVNMLKPGGVLMIVTPDFDSPVARMFQIKPLEHILYFNSRSLRFAADELNLKIELLKRTTRKRSLKALSYSTTFSGNALQKKIIQALSALHLNPIINLALGSFVKDELLMVLRK